MQHKSFESDYSTELAELRSEIAAIQERNKRVEQDKAWETSITRRAFVTGITYFTTAIVFFSIDVERPLLAALIPTTGYILSTLSLPIVRNYWNSKGSAHEDHKL